AGPFDQWPTGMGFDYFYGFVGGDANQWQPNLFRNTTAIYPYYNNPGWNLITGMADDAIEYLRRTSTTCPAPSTHRITRRRSGSRRSATCTCSTTGGTSFAIPSSPTRNALNFDIGADTGTPVGALPARALKVNNRAAE